MKHKRLLRLVINDTHLRMKGTDEVETKERVGKLASRGVVDIG
jgi:hypothetical protein